MIGEIFAIMAALTWAIGSIFDKIGLQKISPLTANTLRSIPTAIFTFILMIVFEGTNNIISTTLLDLAFIIIGSTLALIIGDYFFLYSLKKLGVSTTMPLVSIYPIFALTGAFLFLSENIPLSIIIGTILVISGIFMFNRTKRNDNLNGEKKNYLMLIPVFSALMWGLSQVFFGVALLNVLPFTMTTIRLFYFSAFLTSFNLISGDRHFYKKYNSYWGKMATIGGFFALGLGGLFLMLGISYVGVAKTSPLTSITPLFSTFLAVILLKEKIDYNIVTGTILIVLGIILITVI